MSSVPAATSRAYDASREGASAPPAPAHPPVNAETAGIAVAVGTFRHWPPRNRRNRPKPVPPQARIDSPQGPRPDQPFRPHTTDVMPAGPTIAHGLVRGALPASGQLQTPATIHTDRLSKRFRHRRRAYAGCPGCRKFLFVMRRAPTVVRSSAQIQTGSVTSAGLVWVPGGA